MAINVLLDTCVLKKLVSRTEFSGYLRQIMAWHDNGDIKVYCPKKLSDEWEVHRKKELDQINKIIGQHVQKIKMGKLFEVPTDIGDAQLASADKLLRSQVEAIDKLLLEGIQVKDGHAATIMWQHKEQRKAPFRVKLDSDNDAMILFSTLEDLIGQNNSELYFFSSNHTDYAAIGHSDRIHPDILESYPKISIKYFSEYVEGINALIQLGLPSAKTTVQKKQFVKTLVSVDSGLPLVEQIYSYLEKKFEDVNSLPKKLFAIHFPFIVNSSFNKSPQPFTLETDNPDLYDLFVNLPEQFISSTRNLASPKENDGDNDKKITEIITLLRTNYVHRISFKNKQVNVPTVKSQVCNCLKCTFKRSDFKQVISRFENEIDIETAGLKEAYLHYQLGNIQIVVNILKRISKRSESEKKWLSFYIANYNLSLIGRMYRLSSSSESDSSWIKGLGEIVMEDVYIASRFTLTDDILDYLKEANFMSDATEKVKELALKIKNDYLDKGRGWNSNTSDLLDLYFETIGFMENNFLMLDYFSNASTLTYYFIDGIFASYTCHQELGGKLLHFTDPIVQHIVTYGKSDDIVKCRNRYNIRAAEFIYDGECSRLVSDLINLLNSYQFVQEYFFKSESPDQRFFWKRFRNQFHNSLTLTAIMEISKNDVNLICKALLPFLEIENHFQEFEIAKTIGYFIQNNALLIDNIYLKEFLLHAYTAENVQRDIYIHTISNISRVEDVELILNPAQWEVLQARYLVNAELNDNSTAVSEICCLYDFLKDKKYKNEIAKFMDDYLKFNYNSDVYYTAVIHKIIKPTRKMTLRYEKDMIKRATAGRRPRFFEKSYYTSMQLDQFINFKFCFNHPFDARFINAVSALDNYYRWILDLDGFDYKDFNPDWLFNHLTIYYKERFKNSKALKIWLRKNALKSKNLLISQFYIDLFTTPELETELLD